MTSSQGLRLPAHVDHRIALLDRHTLFVEAMQVVLRREGYDAHAVPLRPAGGDGALLAAVLRTQPRSVLLDLDLGMGVDAMSMIPALVQRGVDVVVVTGVRDQGRWGEALHGGARTVVSKTRTLTEVLAVIRRLHQGLAVESVEQRQRLLGAWHDLRGERAALRAQPGSTDGRRGERHQSGVMARRRSEALLVRPESDGNAASAPSGGAR